MRSSVPTLHCDSSDDWGCDEWSVDYYETSTSEVDGVRITSTERAPGWTSTNGCDYCPDHKPTDQGVVE